ncbi:hypothetical protein RRG08_064959 [Elysia crispata]|uniref:Uncharacterized protein n=1 Tax=Elysia crispata TaxID=231223 RepID=A0AAE1DH50_9GAST|nr:hypothetical protein RRG08_064959 [Elysia crispata]
MGDNPLLVWTELWDNYGKRVLPHGSLEGVVIVSDCISAAIVKAGVRRCGIYHRYTMLPMCLIKRILQHSFQNCSLPGAASSYAIVFVSCFFSVVTPCFLIVISYSPSAISCPASLQPSLLNALPSHPPPQSHHRLFS